MKYGVQDDAPGIVSGRSSMPSLWDKVCASRTGQELALPSQVPLRRWQDVFRGPQVTAWAQLPAQVGEKGDISPHPDGVDHQDTYASRDCLHVLLLRALSLCCGRAQGVY